jgi:hypothetical protein
VCAVSPLWTDLTGPTVFFTEYYGSVNDCESLPYVSCKVKSPVAEGATLTSFGGSPYGRCHYAASVNCSVDSCILVAGL